MRVGMNALFNDIRRQYFSNWKKGIHWVAESYEGRGYCDRNYKKLLIGKPTENYGYICLVIHEATHAVTTKKHGKRWFNRMIKVSNRATELGDHDLAEELASHVEWVKSRHDLGPGDVYARVRDITTDCPNATLEKVTEGVAEYCGQTPEIVRREYPRVAEYYENARLCLRFKSHQEQDQEIGRGSTGI